MPTFNSRRRPLVRYRHSAKTRQASVHTVAEALERRCFLSAASASPISPLDSPLGGGVIEPDGSTSPNGLGYTVAQLRGAYGLGPVGSSNITFGGVQGDGTGQTIALVVPDNDPDIKTDLTTFDSAENLAAPPSFTVLNQSGQTTPLPTNSSTSGSGDYSSVDSLMVEWSHAMAPGASIILVETGTNVFAGVTAAAAYAGVSVVDPYIESNEFSNESSYYDSYFTTPTGHTGVTFLAPTGDAAGEVNYPATSPDVVAVGGTTLNVSGSAWSSEGAWTSSGGGSSAYEAEPTFQQGTFTSSHRETPDISLDGNPTTGVPIVDSWDNSASAPWAGVWGGTELSAALATGIIAIANQGRAVESLGALTSPQTLTRLYQLSKANFHDIISGSNGHQAVTGYDEASGIGSPIGNVFVPDLAGAGTVTGRIFVDSAGNGIYGGNDTPIVGDSVYLDLNNDGSLDNGEPSTTTNSSGIYTFADQPAGGVIRLTTPAQSGYTLTSASTANIVYGATDTANFTYAAAAQQLAITQQPAAKTASGATLAPIMVAVTDANGNTVPANTSAVTLTLSSGAFGNGSTTATATAVNGIATFNTLQINTLGTYTLAATDGSLTGVTSNSFTIVGIPTAIPQAVSVPAAGATAITLTGSDPDSPPLPLTYTVTTNPSHGTLSGTAPTLTYTPTSGYAGADSFQFVTGNGTGTSSGATISITIAKATPVITWPTPASIIYGTALSGTQLDATASMSGMPGTPNLPGTFVYNPAAGTVLGAGAGQPLGVTFTPTDSVDYTTASASVLITVNLPSLNISSGTYTIPAGDLAGITILQYSSITVASGAELAVTAAGIAPNRTLIQTNNLNLGTHSVLDLNNNDLDVIGGNFTTLDTLVTQGLTTGAGILSSTASGNLPQLTTLGVILNGNTYGTASGTPSPFDGIYPAPADVLIKYTYYGDTNLDGFVDGSDYTNIDNGFHNKLTGWINGDFNYDNIVDGSDYTLIDNAFNTETGKLSAQVATQIKSIAKPKTMVFSTQPMTATSLSSEDAPADKRRRVIDDVEL